MAKQRRALDPEVQQLLDRLKVTAQQLFDFPNDPARGAVSGIDTIYPDVGRRKPWFLTPFWRINLDTFNALLANELDPKGIGYCYMMKRKGRLVHARSSGWAQLPSDHNRDGTGGDVRWSFNVPMAIASVTKFITAIAVVKLLRELGIRTTKPILRYLPQYWTRGPNIDRITFNDLLRHESGLGSSFSGSFKPGTSDILSARQEIAAGPSGSPPWGRSYKNINYTILRVLFATLTGTLDTAITSPVGGLSEDSFWDFVSASVYANFVNDNIFAAADIDTRGFLPQENAAKAYATPPRAPGSQVGDDTANAGQRGWHLSISELMRVLGTFRRDGSILPSWRADQLVSNLYGLDQEITTMAGSVFTKNGRTPFVTQGMDSAIHLMPGGVEFAIFVNSFPPPPPRLPDRPPVPIPSYLDRIPQLVTESVEFIL